jgi:four helix bundle protein
VVLGSQFKIHRRNKKIKMTTITKLEELKIWQLFRIFSREIYKITKYPEFSRDFKLIDQITGSSGSIMDNIAEGFGRGGNKEFSNFLTMSVGSANESQSQLYRALDQEYIKESEFTFLYGKADEIIHKAGKLIQYLKGSNYRSIKYK